MDVVCKKNISSYTHDQILPVTENSSSKWLQNTIEIKYVCLAMWNFYPNRKVWASPPMLSNWHLKFHKECFPPPDSFHLGLDFFKTILKHPQTYLPWIIHPALQPPVITHLHTSTVNKRFCVLYEEPFSVCNYYFLLSHLRLLSPHTIQISLRVFWRRRVWEKVN